MSDDTNIRRLPLAIKRICETSTVAMAQSCFPKKVYRGFSGLQMKFINAVDSRKEDGYPANPNVSCIAPKKWGKSTTLEIYCTRRIASREARHILYVGHSLKQAKQKTNNIKDWLVTSPTFRSTWGDVTFRISDKITRAWGEESWVAYVPGIPNDAPPSDEYMGTQVTPVGADQAIPGQIFDQWPPDTLIIDDFESRADEDTVSITQDMSKKFWEDIIQSMNFANPWNQVVFIETYPYENAIILKLRNAPGWASLDLSAIEEHEKGCKCDHCTTLLAAGYSEEVAAFKTCDEKFLPQNKLTKRAQMLAHVGELDTIRRQWGNKRGQERQLKFDKNWFKFIEDYPKMLEDVTTDPLASSFILVDPAKGKKTTSSHTAILAGIVRPHFNQIIVPEVTSGMFMPSEMHASSIDLFKKYRCRLIGCELAMAGTHTEEPFQQAMREAGIVVNEDPKLGPVTWMELKPTGGQGGPGIRGNGKWGRIYGMAGPCQRGEVYLSRQYCQTLIAQLVAGSDAGRLDEADVFGYILQAMGKLGLMFQQQPGRVVENKRDFAKELSSLRREQDAMCDIDSMRMEFPGFLQCA